MRLDDRSNIDNMDKLYCELMDCNTIDIDEGLNKLLLDVAVIEKEEDVDTILKHVQALFKACCTMTDREMSINRQLVLSNIAADAARLKLRTDKDITENQITVGLIAQTMMYDPLFIQDEAIDDTPTPTEESETMPTMEVIELSPFSKHQNFHTIDIDDGVKMLIFDLDAIKAEDDINKKYERVQFVIDALDVLYRRDDATEDQLLSLSTLNAVCATMCNLIRADIKATTKVQ